MVPPNSSVYHATDAPPGRVPLTTTDKSKDWEPQIVVSVAIISKKLVVNAPIPSEPSVAPFGGKFETKLEFVTPFNPPSKISIMFTALSESADLYAFLGRTPNKKLFIVEIFATQILLYILHFFYC